MSTVYAECPECGWEGDDGMGCEWLFGYLSEAECGNCHSEFSQPRDDEDEPEGERG